MLQPIRRIGNSQGIILPRPLLQQAGIDNEVDIEVVEGGIMLRSLKKHPRAGWDEAFQKALDDGQEPDSDLFSGLENTFDEQDWTW